MCVVVVHYIMLSVVFSMGYNYISGYNFTSVIPRAVSCIMSHSMGLHSHDGCIYSLRSVPISRVINVDLSCRCDSGRINVMVLSYLTCGTYLTE